MIRFANPGTDIEHMVNIFKKIYAQLSDFSSFDLNNISEVMTSANMASSKGYVGEEALKRSYAIKDFSRNPLYNQAKMYAEIYRMFGWMNSASTALNFNFTLLGAHVALSGNSTKLLIEQCLLGIHFPNDLIDVRFTNKGKPYIAILEHFTNLENKLYRDEMILGALNLENSDDEEELQGKVSLIKEMRSSYDSKTTLQNHMEIESERLGISCNTMRNYTRLLIAALKYTGWAIEKKVNIYGNNIKFFELTSYGQLTYEKIKNKTYITEENLRGLNASQINAVCKYGFLSFLREADFSVENDLVLLENEKKIVQNLYGTDNIFFNPFQTLSRLNILQYFPEGTLETNQTITKSFKPLEFKEIESKITYQPKIRSQKTEKKRINKTQRELQKMLYENNNDKQKVTSIMMESALTMKQAEFYPLVSDLFEIIFQLDVRTPQPGVNNERFDLVIPHDKYSIPVEVKSPTEELMLSVKAIRQALENKIILLSRKSYVTEKSISSIAVGFNIPNLRSDVYLLIKEIKETYDINISITNIESLLRAAINCLENEKRYGVEYFKGVMGVIKFEDL